MPAGNLHAYLRGVGVEIMAASDNVLRGGFTPKRVDVPELLRVLRYEVLAEPVVSSVPLGADVVTWPTPIDEFRLVRASSSADGPGVTLPVDGPRAVLCVSGRVSVADGDHRVELTPGHAVFVAAERPAVRIIGAGTVFQAGTRASA
jgi:mannose-6-phosphate isomerase